MNPKTSTIFLGTLTFSVGLGIIFYIWFCTNNDLVRNFDFAAFVNGASIIKSGNGSNLYDIDTQKRFLFSQVDNETMVVFKNPPTLALFFVPFADIYSLLSYKIIASILLAFAFLSSILISKLFGKLNKYFVVLTTISFVPGALSILTGQLSYLLLIDWLLTIGFLANKRDLAAGLTTGLLFNKPQYLLMAPFLLFFVSNKKKYIVGLLAVIVAHIIISGLLIGFHNFSTYFYFLKDTENFRYGSDPYSQISFSSLLFNISGPFGVIRGREYLLSSVGYLLSFVYYKLNYSFKKRDQLLYALPLLILVFSPHAWDYDLTITLPSFFYLIYYSKKQILINKRLIPIAAILLYFGWSIRFLGFPYLISLILLISAFIIIHQQRQGLSTT